MKICMVSKFPPIQGGIASRTYWLARGLAEAGCEITVITNSDCVEKEYKITGCDDHLKSLKNIKIYSIGDDNPWHIPNSHLFTTRLLNSVLEILKLEQFDLIDSGYLVPYGIVAYLAHKITSIPYIIRHGGSDIAKFMNHPEYRTVIEAAIKHASAVITDKTHADLFSLLNDNVVILPPYVPDERLFKPSTKKKERSVFAYIGKINYHWHRRGLDKIVEIFKELNSCNYQLLFVAQGLGLENFKKSIENQMIEQISFQSFIPPWEIPSLLSSIDYLFHFEIDEPIKSPSNLVVEALASGVEIITNYDLPAVHGVHRINLDKIALCVNYLNNLKQKEALATPASVLKGLLKELGYQDYIRQNIEIYRNTI